MGGLADLLDTALREFRDNPVIAIFAIFILTTVVSSLYVAVLLIRLVAFADYRDEIALRLADPDAAHRLPKIFQFRKRGVLPADRPGDWQRLEDLSNWMRNEAWKRLARVAVGIPIAALMISTFISGASSSELEESGRPLATSSATPDLNATRVACTRNELPRFLTAIANSGDAPLTPIVVPCTNIGTQVPFGR